MNTKKLIESANGTDEVVVVSRESYDDTPIEGYVVATGSKFFLIESISETLRLDAYCCLRYKDVDRCEVSSRRSIFFRKVMAQKGLEILRNVGIEMTSLERIVLSSRKKFDLLAIYFEEEDPDYCLIGSIVEMSEDTLRMIIVGPEGDVVPDIAEIPVEDITRVDFGGEYMETIGLLSKTALERRLHQEQKR